MSKVIKASRVKGKYRLNDVKAEPELEKTPIEDESLSEINNSETAEEMTEQMKEVNKKAEKLIAEAREEAKQILEEAQREATELVQKKEKEAEKEGYQKGHQAGYEEGYQSGLDELRSSRETLEKVITTAKQEMKANLESLPAQVINLAASIASRIINVKLEVSPEYINDIVADILTEVGSYHEEIVIKVNPGIIDYINKGGVQANHSRQKVEFIADPALRIGDCIIETNFGGIDGTLDNKLKLLEKELYKGAGLS